jgi:LysM repeat protein
MNMIDCATQLNNVSCGILVQNGITHVGRYLPTQAWKGLTSGEVIAIKSSGLNLISIFESGATQNSYFTNSQGVSDANQAYQLAKSLGQPEGTAIYFTVDFDAQVKDFAAILNYFQGLRNTLTSYKIGVYGKFEVIQLLQSKGLADYFWQTYAWSSGQHAKGLNLFQYKNDINQYGLNLDLDQIENDDCGGWNNSTLSTFVDNPDGTSPFLTTVQVIAKTDIRQQPDHSSLIIKNGYVGELYNVIGHLDPDWHEIILDDNGNAGWIDGNNGQNLIDVKNGVPSKTQSYKVQDGQTLTKIASIFTTTVQNLLILNPNIANPNKIYPGQTIIVPK